MISRVIIIASLLLLMVFPARADHYMGGEIRWECLPNGNFRFILVVYRDCMGMLYPNTVDLQSTYPIGAIPMSLVDRVDLSPVCNQDSSFTHIECQAHYPYSISSGAVEEWTYTSDSAYPAGVTISGVPPPEGWVFYSSSCCRSPCSNIPGASILAWCVRAKMLPYNGQSTFPCWDNSPVFAEKPLAIICSGSPFSYSHNAYDPELDSLAFEWGQPLNYWLNTPITNYSPGYSYTSPLPSAVHNPNNIAASLNPFSGEISFTSYTAGSFVTVTKVSAYNNGIKIAEIYREMSVILMACSTNQPPTVSAPFKDPVTGLYTAFADTFYAGELISFDLNVVDSIPLVLSNGSLTSVELTASGSQFSTDFTSNTVGCLNPPCATLSPPPPINNQVSLSTTFSWQTSCTHLNIPGNNPNASTVYNFVFTAKDDFCPIPGVTVRTASVVLKRPILKSPHLKCVSVGADGDVILNWIPPDTTVIPNTFNSYHIYSATSPSGPFTQLDSVFDYTMNTYIHTSGAAGGVSRYYYLKCRSGCDGKYYSASSDTLRSIILQASPIDDTTGLLEWNPAFKIAGNTYEIFREYPSGNWVQIGSSMDTTFVDTMHLCYDSVSYRVRLSSGYDCSSSSSISKTYYLDGDPPPIPHLDSVSIGTANGYAVLGWTAITNSEVGGYIIYRNDGGWFVIDTVYGHATKYYEDEVSITDPCSLQHYYAIAAFDTCGNVSAPGFGESQSTILLDIKDYDQCIQKVTLDWTPYQNMSPEVSAYEVYQSIAGGSFILLVKILPPGPQTAPQSTFYIQGLNPGIEYCYYVKALNSTGVSSTSCTKCIQPMSIPSPDITYLRYASVEHDVIHLCLSTDASVKNVTYCIMRSDAWEEHFKKIGSVSPNGNPEIHYYDYSASVKNTSYDYKIVALDSCGNAADTSNIARSILLKGYARPDFINELWWNEYIDWNWATGNTYHLYRETEGKHDRQSIASLNFGQLNYEDDISEVSNSLERLTYWVVAKQGSGQPDFRDSTSSNLISLQQEARLYIPNAFTPGGLNPVFKPVQIFADPTDYSFIVYNRWGQEIFSTTSTEAGWDGRYNGSYVAAGVYVYVVRYRNNSGILDSRTGSVTVIF